MKNIRNYKKFLEVNKDLIQFPIKKFMSIIKSDIEGKIVNGLNELIYNFEDEKTLPISFTISINYDNNININWTGYINKSEVEKPNSKGISFQDFRIYINGGGIIDYSQIYSILNHELKHVYDLYYSNYNDSFDRVDAYKYLINKYKNINEIVHFLELSNLALEHELEARNSMIYDKLRWLKTFDIKELRDEFKKSYVYRSLLMISEFDYSDILLLDSEISLNFTNEYIRLFMKSDEILSNNKDLIEFYKGIKEIFIKKSEEYLDKCELVLDELVKDKRPYMENKLFILDDSFYDPEDNHLLRLEEYIVDFFK